MDRAPDEQPAIADWIWRQNLHPWLQICGRISGYGLDDLDWAMIDLEVESTDAGRDQWFDYRFDGDVPVFVSIAHDADAALTTVKVWCPDHLRPLIALATAIANSYQLR